MERRISGSSRTAAEANGNNSGNKDKAREACNLLVNANREEDEGYIREAAERIIAGL